VTSGSESRPCFATQHGKSSTRGYHRTRDRRGRRSLGGLEYREPVLDVDRERSSRLGPIDSPERDLRPPRLRPSAPRLRGRVVALCSDRAVHRRCANGLSREIEGHRHLARLPRWILAPSRLRARSSGFARGSARHPRARRRRDERSAGRREDAAGLDRDREIAARRSSAGARNESIQHMLDSSRTRP